MNEADTSNNRAVMESLNSANSPQPEQVNCPFYSVVPSETMAATNLPLLQPTESHSEEDVTQPDWVAEPEREKQTLIDVEFQKLLTLNEELRTANNDLYKQVEHLKDDLAESEKALQWQKRRSNVAESMLNQQTQELTVAQEHIQSLFQQLETAVQTTQRQEIFIESYKTQLQISQQRLAQLERECALLQTNYNEQSQQVSQSENACRELRTRLMRQQRQTLQFKAALEKCLEAPVPSYESLDETENNSPNSARHQTRFSKKARSLFPNAQPIKPWSAEPDSLDEDSQQPWGESPAPFSCTSNNSELNPPSLWNWQAKENTPPVVSSEEIDDSSEIVSAQLDEQLNSLIQMFFVSQPISVSPKPPVIETNTNQNQVDNSVIWETLATNVENEENLKTQPEQEFSALEVENNPDQAISTSWEESTHIPVNNSPLSFTLSPIEQTAEKAENYWAEESQINQEQISTTNLPQESFVDFSNDTQSPSPVIYPKRPPKGRKSLASVELPNFRPASQ